MPLSKHPHYVAPLVETLRTEWGSLSNWSDPVSATLIPTRKTSSSKMASSNASATPACADAIGNADFGLGGG